MATTEFRQPKLADLIEFANGVHAWMWDCIWKYPAGGRVRWRVEQWICRNVDPYVAAAMKEARQNGEINNLGPMIVALGKAVHAYAYRFATFPQGNTMPKEPSDLLLAAQALSPYVEWADPANNVVAESNYTLPDMTQTEIRQYVKEQAKALLRMDIEMPDEATLGRWADDAKIPRADRGKPYKGADIEKMFQVVAYKPRNNSKHAKVLKAILKALPRK